MYLYIYYLSRHIDSMLIWRLLFPPHLEIERKFPTGERQL